MDRETRRSSTHNRILTENGTTLMDERTPALIRAAFKQWAPWARVIAGRMANALGAPYDVMLSACNLAIVDKYDNLDLSCYCDRQCARYLERAMRNQCYEALWAHVKFYNISEADKVDLIVGGSDRGADMEDKRNTARLKQIDDREELSVLFKALTPIERIVVKMSYGIGDCERTLEEIGEQLDCSKQWVSQVRQRALGKMQRAKHEQQES